MLRYLEEARHNDAYERETVRSNKARELETYRSNLARETTNRWQLLETNRHNTMAEYLERSNLSESIRHNKQNEEETNRANVAKETEINRHNTEEEKIKWAQTDSQGSLNQAKTIGEYVGGAVDLIGSAMGWWNVVKGNKSKKGNTQKKSKPATSK